MAETLCQLCNLPLMKTDEGQLACFNPECVKPSAQYSSIPIDELTPAQVLAPPRKVNYLNAIIPKQYEIGGRTMKDFSLGHLFAMEYFKIDAKDQKSVATNFVIAYLICQRTWNEIKYFITHPKYFRRQVWWAQLRLNLRYDILTECAKFWQYVSLAVENYPTTKLNDQQKKWVDVNNEKGSPPLMALLVASTDNVRHIDQLMDVSVERLIWYLNVKNELSGNVTIDPIDNPEFDAVKNTVKKYAEANFASDEERARAFLEGKLD